MTELFTEQHQIPW